MIMWVLLLALLNPDTVYLNATVVTMDVAATEAQAVAALNHFNMVQIHDYGHSHDGPFIVMELVSGGSLSDKLQTGAMELDC